MIEFTVLTAWQLVAGELMPGVALKYKLKKWIDVTGQNNLMPDPNLYVLYCLAESAVFDLIQADTDYQVLWSKEA